MKEIILKILSDNTEVIGRYDGGDETPIISFKNSDDCDKESFLSQVAEEIVKELSKN